MTMTPPFLLMDLVRGDEGNWKDGKSFLPRKKWFPAPIAFNYYELHCNLDPICTICIFFSTVSESG